MRRLDVLLLLLGLIGAGCNEPDGVEGLEGEAYFETDLVGASRGWPSVAVGSVYQVTAETAECLGEDEELLLQSSDTAVLEVLASEFSGINQWGCSADVEARVAAVGEGTAMLELVDQDGLVIDRISTWVSEPEEVRLSIHEVPLDGDVALVVGTSATLVGDVLSTSGETLAHSGLEVSWVPDDGRVQVAPGERGDEMVLTALEAGPAGSAHAGFGSAHTYLRVHPIEEVAVVDVAVRALDRREFRVHVAAWSSADELTLDAPYEVELLFGAADEIRQGPAGFLIEAPDDLAPMRLRVTSGPAQVVFGVRDSAEDDATYRRLIEDGPPDEAAAGCVLAPGANATPWSLLATAAAAIAFYRRRRR